VIKQAAIEFNGQVYKTSPVKITVTNAVQQSQEENDAQISADNNLYLVADVSKSNPYINEPLPLYINCISATISEFQIGVS